ncbi:hypothetical protein ACFRMQ_08400 [Kitasatospora sp. NPDC056783]|uniref:hypothetical protein n=1 Tax=Kitasatospora sp. NPDC056783 TaxID=3345943 RepID=UPI00367E64D0
MNDILNGTGWHFDAETGLTTRNPKPTVTGPTPLFEVLALPDDLLRQAVAAHEAGHVAAMLHFGIPFKSVAIRDDLCAAPNGGNVAEVDVTCGFSVPLYTGLVAFAAGERAQDRWLREAGLWTSVRGWAAEAGALGDRREIYRAVDEAFGRDVTFGASDDPCRDMSALHDHTDALLDTLWDQATALADALSRRGRLTEQQAAEVTGLSPRAGWRR